MFTDARSQRIVFVAHCVLNQNAISDGTADFPGVDEAVVRRLLTAGVGIVQLPCPELNCLGLDRGDPEGASRPVIVENSRIRQALGQAAPARILAGLVEQVAFQVEQYHQHGFHLMGLVGINRSPSCGVETTSDHDEEVPGRGVFLEALATELERRGIHLPMVGVKTSLPEATLAHLETLLA